VPLTVMVFASLGLRLLRAELMFGNAPGQPLGQATCTFAARAAGASRENVKNTAVTIIREPAAGIMEVSFLNEIAAVGRVPRS
jgi:hypothetical protein